MACLQHHVEVDVAAHLTGRMISEGTLDMKW
jgi:hypothetical protein